MDMSSVAQLITSLGFPVVACIMMGYYIKIQTDYYRNDIKDLQTQHKEEMSKVTEAVNNNTKALLQLSDSLIARGVVDGNND